MADEKTPAAAPKGGKESGRTALQTLMDTRVRPAIEKGTAFYNARNKREKIMLVVFAAAFLLFIDYWVLVRPVVSVFTVTMPRLAALDVELDGLRRDKKDRAKIAERWEAARMLVEEREGTFITRDRVPALLENISKLAMDSGVKILSLKPLAATPVSGRGAKAAPVRKDSKRYPVVPLRLNALAGTHELGAFLARLESDETFFRVTSVRVLSRGETDPRRHEIEVNLETYSRAQLKAAKK